MNAQMLDALNNFTDDICTVMIVLIGVMGPVWLLAQYMKFRAAKQAPPQDAALVAQLTHIADRMDQRMAAVERILDADSPSWRGGNNAEGYYERKVS